MSAKAPESVVEEEAQVGFNPCLEASWVLGIRAKVPNCLSGMICFLFLHPIQGAMVPFIAPPSVPAPDEHFKQILRLKSKTG